MLFLSKLKGKKHFTEILRFFIFGFVTAAIINFLPLSGCKTTPSNPADNNDTDVSKINAGAKLVEEAFLSGDTTKLINLLTETAKKSYSSSMKDIQPKMVQFGNIFKTRVLDAYSKLYAEYSYAYDNKTFTVAFALQDDGTWKLMRF